MFTKGDFHIHTNASDGKYTGHDIINFAKQQCVDILSITDHDTTESVESTVEFGKKHGILVIPGIELSTLYYGESVHILGYFNGNSYKKDSFQKFLKNMNDYRKYRAEKITENLYRYFNIKLDFNKILQDANGIVARPHIAKAIIEAGYDYSWDYIFQNFIGEDSPAYVPNKKLHTNEGIELLKSTGAIVVLAHPVLISKSCIQDVVNLDFDGIEAIYPMNTEKDTKKFIEIAQNNSLIITAGSDFHGISKSDESHADKIGAVHLDSNNIQIFLEKLAKNMTA